MKSDQQDVNIPFFEWTEREDGSGVATYNFGRHPVLVSIESATQAAHLAGAIETELAERDARIVLLEDALRNLANECDNDYVAGWEGRMTACIQNASAVLGLIPATPQPSEKLVNWGAVEGQAKAWLAVCTLIRELSPGCFLQPNKTSPEIVSEYIRDWHADACQYHIVMAEGLTPQRPAVPEGWRIIEKKSCYVLAQGNAVVASLAGPDAEENAAKLAALLSAQQPVSEGAK